MTTASDEELFARFEANSPASTALIAQSETNLRFRLPADYVQFLHQRTVEKAF